MSTGLIVSPAPDNFTPALFAPTPKAAKRVMEFFTGQVKNDHTRKAHLNATRRFASWCEAHEIAQPPKCSPSISPLLSNICRVNFRRLP